MQVGIEDVPLPVILHVLHQSLPGSHHDSPLHLSVDGLRIHWSAAIMVVGELLQPHLSGFQVNTAFAHSTGIRKSRAGSHGCAFIISPESFRRFVPSRAY